ncbi:hypothetical protein B0187_05935 [Haemophilus paracuniculus]|uniref:Uncharacterized protein n=1 Tax=Haemophilus paracuniculus TaxID=734 RepID=A0A1T0ASU6_9PAST|nr:hypothetical protein [Haemophilus paracuniculus]OOR99295.1 hypothetical protein B0187_05935 [Haemophilus paracuniculus]
MTQEKESFLAKYYWHIVWGVIALALSALATCLLFGKFSSTEKWQATVEVFALLGIFLAIATVIPVIVAIFSYQQFTRNVKQAESHLTSLSNKIGKQEERVKTVLSTFVEKEKQVDLILKREQNRERVYRYLNNSKSLNDDEIQILKWYLFDIKNQNSFTLYDLIAKNDFEQNEIFQRKDIFEVENVSDELELKRLQEQEKQLYQMLWDYHYPMYPAMKKTMQSILKPEE